MRLTPEDLPSAGYRLLSSLDHGDIIPFVEERLGSGNRIVRNYFRFTFLLLAAAVGLLAWNIIRAPGQWGHSVALFFGGMGLAFLLTPIHELIHVAALKAVGAPSVQLRANWRKLYFMAGSDRFVADVREFYWIAFAPFAVISLGALALMFWQPLAATSLLFLHTAFCVGDFALASYMNEHREEGIVTYDLMKEGVSYFFVREQDPGL